MSRRVTKKQMRADEESATEIRSLMLEPFTAEEKQRIEKLCDILLRKNKRFVTRIRDELSRPGRPDLDWWEFGRRRQQMLLGCLDEYVKLLVPEQAGDPKRIRVLTSDLIDLWSLEKRGREERARNKG